MSASSSSDMAPRSGPPRRRRNWLRGRAGKCTWPPIREGRGGQRGGWRTGGWVRGDDAEAGEVRSTTSPRRGYLSAAGLTPRVADGWGRGRRGPLAVGRSPHGLTRAGKGGTWRVEPSWLLLPGSEAVGGSTRLRTFFLPLLFRKY